MTTSFLRGMTGHIAPAAVALGLALGAAPARAEYAGGGYLSDYSGCEANGWPVVTEMFRARYSPSEEGGRNCELVLNLAVGGVMVYRLNSTMAPSRLWRTAQGFATWGALYASNPRPSLRVVERRNATTGNASIPRTPEIYMQVRIRNFNGARGCTVTANIMLRHTG